MSSCHDRNPEAHSCRWSRDSTTQSNPLRHRSWSSFALKLDFATMEPSVKPWWVSQSQQGAESWRLGTQFHHHLNMKYIWILESQVTELSEAVAPPEVFVAHTFGLSNRDWWPQQRHNQSRWCNISDQRRTFGIVQTSIQSIPHIPKLLTACLMRTGLWRRWWLCVPHELICHAPQASYTLKHSTGSECILFLNRSCLNLALNADKDPDRTWGFRSWFRIWGLLKPKRT